MNFNITTNVWMFIGMLQNYFYKNGKKNALILHDVNVVNNEIIKETLSLLKPKNILLVDRDPTMEDVNIAVKHYPQTENIIAVGGGSTMDLGKTIAVTLTNGGDVKRLRDQDRISRPGLPIIALLPRYPARRRSSGHPRY